MSYSEPILNRADIIKCALCDDAPCTAACGKLDPASLLRSIWFTNSQCAALSLPEINPCLNCDAACERACVRAGDIRIRDTIGRLYSEVLPVARTQFPDTDELLRTDICGIEIENPFLLSSSVVASTYDMCARAFDAGWAGVCFKTISTLKMYEASPRYSAIRGDSGNLYSFKNIEQLSDHSVVENMETFRRLKHDYPNKFILASIMGQDESEWEMLAGLCEENGADAIELNFSCPNMVENGLGSDIGQIPEQVEKYTAAARRGCKIPVIAKLTPNVAIMSPAAEAAKRGGADGLAAINTIKAVMNVDPQTFVSSPAVHGESAIGGISGPGVKPISLRFIAEMTQNPALSGMHISGMGGVETWRDAVEYMLLGAGSIQVTTAVMQYGYRIIDDLTSGLALYLKSMGFSSVNQFVGAGLTTLHSTTDTLDRDTIVYPIFERNRCIGCGRCKVSCMDGGHQAISMDENRRPVLNARKCVGCHLCVLVCPERAISGEGKRVPLVRH